jgi:RecA/RadA recombinase
MFGSLAKFYFGVWFDIRRIETLKEGTEAIGNRVRVKVVKTKVASPFKQAEFYVIYGRRFGRGTCHTRHTCHPSARIGMDTGVAGDKC